MIATIASKTVNTETGTDVYTAEYNTMSGRWMVLKNGFCVRAGMSTGAAENFMNSL